MAYTRELIALLQQSDYVPLPLPRIEEALEVPEKERGAFRDTVQELMRLGTVVRLKKDRLCLPADADLVTGPIRFRQSGSATVFPDTAPGQQERDPVPVRAEDTWVAWHGDRVLVRLIPQRRRGRRQQMKKNARGVPEHVEEPVFGRVIRILERARETLTGTLQRSRVAWFVIPDDPRIVQDILVEDPARSPLEPKPKEGDKVVVKLAEWKQRHLNPEGEITQVLGKTHTPWAEYQALLHLYGLNPDFPDAVMNEVEQLPQKVRPSDRRKRRDLRKQHVFTIDPDDAKDFDDALSIEALEGGNWRVGVHIADVSAYVKPNSALDREARQRCNSTYLVGKVIPMLPHALSNGLCSLVEGEDRLTKSVFLTFSARGKLIEGEIELANTVINSRKRLTYKQAYAFLNEDDNQAIRALPVPPAHQTGSTGRALAELNDGEMDLLRTDIRQLWMIASKLRNRRMAKGSLDLDMPETKIYVDADGYADRIEKVEHDESHQLIEEFMLAANEAIARKLHLEDFPLIHRVHDKPDPDKLDELRETLLGFGIETGDLSARKHVTALLQKIKEHPQAHILRIEFLRSLKQAGYRSTADGHYGLAKQLYVHFTSPIRRYADLLVHRQVDHYLLRHAHETAPKKSHPYTAEMLSSLAEHISHAEQNSVEAERESVKIKLLEFFERELTKQKPTVFPAVITDLRNHGMFIELTESMAFGMIHISTLRDDLYKLNRDETEFIGRRKGRRFGIGDKIGVVAHRVDRFKRQIDFKLAE